MDIIRSASRHLGRLAMVTPQHLSFRYQDLLDAATSVAATLRAAPTIAGRDFAPGVGPRIAIMASPGAEYVSATFGTWLACGIAVPLCLSHPAKELQYVLDDSEAAAVLVMPEHADRMAPLARASGASLEVLQSEIGPSGSDTAWRGSGPRGKPPWARNDRDGSIIVYTSGTTGRPKGVLHTHASIAAQVSGLLGAWGWSQEDRILHALPLHHVHGIVNALYCPLACGAAVEVLPKFSPAHVWQRLMREEDPITVLMGVPTMYSILLSFYETMEPAKQARAREVASRLRLTVSGSAACPIPVMRAWRDLSGQTLLERYGMTETGMVLSNPLRGERRPGAVGLPLPGVAVRVDEGAVADGRGAGFVQGPGELLVGGGSLFKEYWRRPDATAEAFTADGFFRTGDTAAMGGEPPYWRILGRTSVDILKSGGYKISALDIENVLQRHPNVAEVAVVGVPDAVLGEAVAAIVAPVEASGAGALASATEQALREWAARELPPYQVPRAWRFVDTIPRNAMGKVNKKALRQCIFPRGLEDDG